MTITSTGESSQLASTHQPDIITTQIPLARVKKIMKLDPDVMKLSSDSAFVCTVITEQFIAYLVRHAIQYTTRDKRKTIKYKDLANVVNEVEQFQFLEDVIPMSKSKLELASSSSSTIKVDGANEVTRKSVDTEDSAKNDDEMQE